MANPELAHSYAQAIFEQAVERWRVALRKVYDSIEHAGVATTLDNPVESFDKKKEVLAGALPAHLDAEVRNLVSLLASKNELNLLPEIMAEFDRYVARGPSHVLATVTSAFPLDESERRTLEKKIRARYGKDVDFEYREDKSLLGGVVVRIGDRLIDGSVQGKLNAMRQKLETTR